jgi:hypothetical protein
MRSVRTPSKKELEGRVFDTPSSDGTVCVASGPNTRVYTIKNKGNILCLCSALCVVFVCDLHGTTVTGYIYIYIHIYIYIYTHI